MASSLRRAILFLFLPSLWSSLVACSVSLASDPVVQEEAEKQVETAEVEAESGEADEGAEGGPASVASCADGVVKDDGTVETGYGFVPQATAGIYVQEFHADEFPSRSLETVCVCWLKTKYTRDIDFEVVFYQAAGNLPAAEPYAKVSAVARGLPDSVESAGAFYEVDVSRITIPEGTSYIGVHWNPTQAKYLFLCTDTSEETAKVNVFFQEDRAPAWTSVFASRDPIFRHHRSVLLRARGEVPKNEASAEMHDR